MKGDRRNEGREEGKGGRKGGVGKRNEKELGEDRKVRQKYMRERSKEER